MAKNQISLAAEKIWRNIPKSMQNLIINNVFCGKCRGNTTIINYSVEQLSDTVILIGQCKICGEEVRRVVD